MIDRRQFVAVFGCVKLHWKLIEMSFSSITISMDFAMDPLSEKVREYLISDGQKKELQELRRKLMEHYRFKYAPVVILEHIGTGSGKTTTALLNHLEYVESHKGELRSYCYVTPHKTQMSIPEFTIEKARKLGVKILAFIGRDDMKDLDFIPWASTEETPLNNRDRYRLWLATAKTLPAKYRLEEFKTVHYALKLLDEIERQKKLARNIGTAEQPLDFEESEKVARTILENGLKKLAKAIFKTMNTIAMLRKAYSEAAAACELPEEMKFKNHYWLYTQILDFLVPFVSPLVSPTILLATTKKFDRSILAPIIAAKSGEEVKPISCPLVLVGRDFPSIIGCSKGDEGFAALTAEAARSMPKEQIELIKNKIYAPDPRSIFREAGVSFDIAIDEEHEAHGIFKESTNENLIDKTLNLAHAMAAVNSIRAQLRALTGKEAEKTPYYETKRELSEKIDEAASDVSGIDISVFDRVLNIFVDNVDQIILCSDDAERIIALTRDIFRLGRCTFTNDQALRKVHLRRTCGNRAVEIYFSEEQNSDGITLHDFYQSVLCVISAAGKLEHKPKQFVRYLSDHATQTSSRNHPLGVLINHSRDVASRINGAFDGVVDSKQPISLFFVHFCYKTVFNLLPLEKLGHEYDSGQSYIHISFEVKLIKETPEVALYRMLYNTSNRVFLMSATTGFHGHLADKYHRHFLAVYGESSDANLGIKVIQRRVPETAAQLRRLRESYHRPEIRSIPEFADHIVRQPEQVKEVYDFIWKNALAETAHYCNQYQRRELSRQLSAMLMAAWDSKHTFSLGISMRFVTCMAHFARHLAASGATASGGFKLLDKDGFAFEFIPFRDERKLRVILFTAKVGKQVKEVQDWLTLEDTNTTIVLSSYRKTAGTGVNFFPRYKHSLTGHEADCPYEVDFDRLILVNGPFWSKIIADNGEMNMSSINNLMLLWCRDSEQSEGERPCLGDYNDFHKLTPKQRLFLLWQHLISKLCEDNQNKGRNERKDCIVFGEIFIPEDVIKENCLTYNYLNRFLSNKAVFEQMSVNNYTHMEYCLKRRAEWLCKHGLRESLEKESGILTRKLNTFVEDVIPEVIKAARGGDLEAADFRDAMGSPLIISDPTQFLKTMSALPYVKRHPGIGRCLDSMYLQVSKYGSENMIFCRQPEQTLALTDMDGGFERYEPTGILSTYEAPGLRMPRDDLFKQLLVKCRRVLKPDFKEWLPMPTMLPHLLGAAGESKVRTLLGMLQVKVMTTKEVFVLLGAKAYEQFDIYIHHGDKICCIDVKNWLGGDKRSMSYSLIDSLGGKLETVSAAFKDQGLSFSSVILLNTVMERNREWTEPELLTVHSGVGCQQVQCMNLFEVYSNYKDIPSSKEKDGVRSRIKYRSELERRLTVKKRLVAELICIREQQEALSDA